MLKVGRNEKGYRYFVKYTCDYDIDIYIRRCGDEEREESQQEAEGTGEEAAASCSRCTEGKTRKDPPQLLEAVPQRRLL